MNPLALIALMSPVTDAAKACQVGYLPNETKFAVVTIDATDVVVRRTSDNFPALPVKAGAPFPDPDTGETVRLVDFTELDDPGRYEIEVPGVGRSYPFTIRGDIFARPFRLAMRS
ncbi:MAG TPA: cellulase N-terminal Ig-like domain-containing protein, partial [Fimbriimonas sp.]